MKNTIGQLWIGMALIAGLTGCASKPDGPDTASGPVTPPANPVVGPGGTTTHGGDKPVEIVSAAPNVPSESTSAKPAPWSDAIVATVGKINPVPVTMGELVKPLIESHGLDMLLNVVERSLARQAAESANPPIFVTSEDFKVERERTMGLLFQELDARFQDQIDAAAKAKKNDEAKRLQDERDLERQQLLRQFYEQKHLTPTDFDILIETNAYLRKFAEPKIEGKITDAMLKAEFNARFGEKVRVRHIEMKRPQDAVDVKRRLAAGEKFEDVARQVSTNADAPLEGALLPFTREAPLPKVFKEVAFDLKPGQISDLISVGDTYQLIQLVERIPPSKAVVYEQQRDILFRDVHEQMVQSVVVQMRRNIGAAIQSSLKVTDPVMNKQLQDRLNAMNETAKGKEAAEAEMAKERDLLRQENELRARQEAATQPSTTRPATTAPAPAPVPAAPVPAAPAATAPARSPVVPPAPPAAAPLTRPAAPATAPSARAALRGVPSTAPAARAALRGVPPATRPG